jgi:multidrug resistance efflux pump
MVMPSDKDYSNESTIKLLAMQQDKMHDDIKEINSSLRSVADALQNLAVLEQKHADAMDTIKRAHSRIDKVETDVKTEVKGHEKRIQNLELHDAKTVWIERFVMVILAGILSLWVKGGL